VSGRLLSLVERSRPPIGPQRERRCRTAEQLESGYWRAYREFYRWGSIFRSPSAKASASAKMRHAAHPSSASSSRAPEPLGARRPRAPSKLLPDTWRVCAPSDAHRVAASGSKRGRKGWGPKLDRRLRRPYAQR
jgi:hypothetical protein